MVTYALLATISCSTISKRDAIYTKIETFLSGKPVWGNTTLSKGKTYELNPPDSSPSVSVCVRFTQRPNLDNLFDLVKTELNKLTGIKAICSKHICHHDTDNRPCVVEEFASIER